MLDRAHRALRTPWRWRTPETFITVTLSVTGTRNVLFEGDGVQIFRELPQAAVKRRAAFTPVRNQRQTWSEIRTPLSCSAKSNPRRHGAFTDPKVDLDMRTPVMIPPKHVDLSTLCFYHRTGQSSVFFFSFHVICRQSKEQLCLGSTEIHLCSGVLR